MRKLKTKNENKNKPIVYSNNKTETSQLFTTATASLHRSKNNLEVYRTKQIDRTKNAPRIDKNMNIYNNNKTETSELFTTTLRQSVYYYYYYYY